MSFFGWWETVGWQTPTSEMSHARRLAVRVRGDQREQSQPDPAELLTEAIGGFARLALPGSTRPPGTATSAAARAARAAWHGGWVASPGDHCRRGWRSSRRRSGTSPATRADPGARAPARRAARCGVAPAPRGAAQVRPCARGPDPVPRIQPAPATRVSAARAAARRDLSKVAASPSGTCQGRPISAAKRLLQSSDSFFEPLQALGALDGRCGFRRHHRRGVRAGGSRRQRGGEAVTAENVVGLVLAVALLGALVVALIFPERF